MIVFNGCLTGAAKKYYIDKMMKAGTKLLIILFSMTIPFWVFFSLKIQVLIEGMCTILVTILLLPVVFRLCVSKKEKERINLKKVSIKDGEIKAISEKNSVCNNLSKVKEVRDYGEFYDIVFPSIYFISIYVCQKDLLSTGTLEEFELLFGEKIVRCNTD